MLHVLPYSTRHSACFACTLESYHILLLSVFCIHQLELDGKVGCVHMLLSPDQITHVTDLLAALCIDTGIQNIIQFLFWACLYRCQIPF